MLEIGTGSGYQAAVLAALGLEVFTVERIGDLLRTARKRFRALGLQRAQQARRRPHRLAGRGAVRRHHRHRRRAGAGRCAASTQLAPGGVLVAPVGAAGGQSLLRLRKQADGSIAQEDLGAVVFVPLLSGMTDR